MQGGELKVLFICTESEEAVGCPRGDIGETGRNAAWAEITVSPL